MDTTSSATTLRTMVALTMSCGRRMSAPHGGRPEEPRWQHFGRAGTEPERVDAAGTRRATRPGGSGGSGRPDGGSDRAEAGLQRVQLGEQQGRQLVAEGGEPLLDLRELLAPLLGVH